MKYTKFFQKSLPPNISKMFEISNRTIKPISGISIIMPIRGIDRYVNLEYCISMFLLQNTYPIEIIVSEEDQSEKVDLKGFKNDSRVRKTFTQSDQKPFNKSIAVNAGFSIATFSKIIMNDVDIIPPNNYLEKVDSCLNEYDGCFFGKEIYNVNLLKSGLYWSGSKRVDYFSGGSICFTKNAYINIGGMCEKFYGYGSEDCEFWGRIKNLTKFLEVRDTPFLHINHKRKDNYSVNSDLYDELMAMPMDERLVNLKKDISKRTGWVYK